MVRTLKFGITHCTGFLFKTRIYDNLDLIGPVQFLMEFKEGRLWIIMSLKNTKEKTDEEILTDIFTQLNQWGKMNLIESIPDALLQDDRWQMMPQ